MVRKKVLSKRLTLKDKYRIKKRVAEHERNKRKEARKNPKKRSKLSKEPGVPNLWPQQQEMLKKLSDESKEIFLEKKEAEKTAKRKRSDEDKLTEMSIVAQKAGKEHEDSNNVQFRNLGSFNIKSKESSKKSFFKEFKKVVKMADVILQVLDARDPLGCRSYSTEQQILNLDPNKKIILVLNKIDLIPKENLDKWLAYLRNSYPTIAFKASTQKQKSNLSRKEKDVSEMTQEELMTSKCFGANTLIALLKNYCRSKDLKTAISVGVIGFPNVGKSSIINSLKRSRAVNVGSVAGVTKNTQEVTLDKLIKLIDCPGVVFSSEMTESEAALRNCINLDQLSDYILPVQLILNKVSKESLEALYKIPKFGGPTDFLGHVAKKRGKVGQGGVLDYQRAGREVIQDWNSGRIPYYCIPPDVDPSIHGSFKIVSNWSDEFKFENVMEMEKKEINDMDEDVNRFVFSKPSLSTPIVADAMFSNLDDNDDDNMAVTWNKESTLTMANIKEKKEKSSETPPKKTKLEQDPNNPQINADRKKQLEKEKNKRKKENNETSEIITEEENKNEKYDFSVDFWKKPLPNIISNNNNNNNNNNNSYNYNNDIEIEEDGSSSDDDDEDDSDNDDDEEEEEDNDDLGY